MQQGNLGNELDSRLKRWRQINSGMLSPDGLVSRDQTFTAGFPSPPVPAPSIVSPARSANRLPGHIFAQPSTKNPFVRLPFVSQHALRPNSLVYRNFCKDKNVRRPVSQTQDQYSIHQPVKVYVTRRKEAQAALKFTWRVICSLALMSVVKSPQKGAFT